MFTFNRFLSALYLGFFALSGRGKHWRNEQDFGLIHHREKTLEDNEVFKRLLQTEEEPLFVGRYGTTELKEFLRYYRVFNRHDGNMWNTLKAIMFSEPKCWGLDTNGGGTQIFRYYLVFFLQQKKNFTSLQMSFIKPHNNLTYLQAGWC